MGNLPKHPNVEHIPETITMIPHAETICTSDYASFNPEGWGSSLLSAHYQGEIRMLMHVYIAWSKTVGCKILGSRLYFRAAPTEVFGTSLASQNSGFPEPA